MKKKNKGFTLIELLTVIAILAVILLIAAPIILGVLDKARKNTFKNQVLLYVEGLKQQTALALMGSGYSELQNVDSSFYAPTSDSENKLVRVSTTDLNKIMDAPTLKNGEYYFYVESTTQGYNYYIGQDVNQENGYKTTCAYATGNESCTERSYDSQDIKIFIVYISPHVVYFKLTTTM